jgi:hypothetical protein
MGIVEIVSSVPLRVSEGGRTLGTSAAPLRLPLGRHTLELRNDELGFQAAQAVDVRQGRTERIQPALPTGLANLNATPWAEVWIDGRRVGETPLGRVELTIGAHEIRFRHPELGEQSRTVTITAGKVALLSVELSK